MATQSGGFSVTTVDTDPAYFAVTNDAPNAPSGTFAALVDTSPAYFALTADAPNAPGTALLFKTAATTLAQRWG